MGLTTPPYEINYITETTTIETTTRGPIADLSQPGSMTTPAESLHQEGRCATDSLLGPKTKISIGTWNVRTMNKASKLAQVIREMKRYIMDILGVSKCRWTGSGRQMTHDGSTILYSGHEDTHIRGVALVISKQKANTLLEWEPISDRIMKAHFNSKHCKFTIILCYAPTNESDTEDKENWYEQLQQAVAKVPQHDMLLIIGDMNAKVGSENSNCERAMGKHGCGVMNDNGERLVDFCLNNNYVIGGTIFANRDIHKLTWKSPDGRTNNQINHIIINGKWRRSLQDVRVCRGADIYCDHYLVTAHVKLKLHKVVPESQRRKQLYVTRLACPVTKQEFILELRNRFSALTDTSEEPDHDATNKWDTIKKTYVKVATKVLGYKKKNHKERLTPETCKKIEQRKQLKIKMLSTKSARLQKQVQEAYKGTNKEVKKSARNDKRSYVGRLAAEAESAAARGELSTVYKITKRLCGNYTTHSAPVKGKDGSTVTTEHEQADRWVEYFCEVLNHPQPDEPADPPPVPDDLNINTNPPTEAEVRNAIKAMKSGKAPGIDSIHAEMLTADLSTATRVLTNLFDTIWDKEIIPSDWGKGLIIKIPKEGIK